MKAERRIERRIFKALMVGHVRLAVVGLFLGLPGGTALAASFDCDKAGTEVEKMICADKELSLLDEKLASAYGKVLKESADSAGLKEEQRGWLKSRVKCQEAECLIGLYRDRIVALQSTAPSPSGKKKPRYKVVQGKGWTVCESYARFLNSLPDSEPLPFCHLKLSPDFPDLKEPDWEEIDIPSHLELVYELEKLTYPTEHMHPVDTFEHWKAIFEQNMKIGKFTPQLRRTRLALIDNGQIKTILSYIPDKNLCDKVVNAGGYTFDAYSPSLFVFNEQEQKIDVYSSKNTFPLPGELLMFKGTPLTFKTYWGGRPQKSGELTGTIYVNHFVLIQEYEPYANLERCKIGFNMPLFEKSIKEPQDSETMRRILE